MPPVPAQQLAEYVRLRCLPGVEVPLRLDPLEQDAELQRWRLTAGSRRAVVKLYAPSASERARREHAGQELGSTLGMAPVLVYAESESQELGGSLIIYDDPAGASLADGVISDVDVRDWLFLLLTLHHLSPESVRLTSSMSEDIAAWWRRNQPAWNACQSAYQEARYRPLLDALAKLHAIVGVRVELHRALWQSCVRRPCHGNPVPAHVVRMGGRLAFTEWDGFGLGDPAMEVGRAAMLALLTGALTPAQHQLLLDEYMTGVRDLRDATLEERLRVFTSVVPLGFCLSTLVLLAAARELPPGPRLRYVEQVRNALWLIQETLGVEVGDPARLLAPLHPAA
jgi:hypothetical protein